MRADYPAETSLVAKSCSSLKSGAALAAHLKIKNEAQQSLNHLAG